MKTLATSALLTALLLTTTSAQAGDANGRSIAVTCWGCHGTDGVSAGAAPSLKGKGAADTVQALQDFASGKRPGTIMDRIAKGYSAAEIQSVADYIAGLK